MIINVDSQENLNTLNNNIKNKDFILWFYADWCGHCKAMKDEWSKFEKTAGNEFNIANVRDDLKDGVEGGCGKNVSGFPKIVAASNGNEVAEHTGGRTLEDLLTFAKENVANNTTANIKPKKSKKKGNPSKKSKKGKKVTKGKKATKGKKGKKAKKGRKGKPKKEKQN